MLILSLIMLSIVILVFSAYASNAIEKRTNNKIIIMLLPLITAEFVGWAILVFLVLYWQASW